MEGGGDGGSDDGGTAPLSAQTNDFTSDGYAQLMHGHPPAWQVSYKLDPPEPLSKIQISADVQVLYIACNSAVADASVPPSVAQYAIASA